MSVYGSPTFKNNENHDNGGSSSDSDGEKHSATSSSYSKKKRLFGRKMPLHDFLGGGTTADIILWRNKQMAGGILAGVSVLWILFEGIGYHLMTLICHCLMLSLSFLFFGSYAAPFVNRTAPTLPEAIVPEDLFMNIARILRHKINRAYAIFRSLASGREVKKFLKIIAGLWLLSLIGSWFSFLNLMYTGKELETWKFQPKLLNGEFHSACDTEKKTDIVNMSDNLPVIISSPYTNAFLILNCLPVLYEKYEDEVDAAARKAMVEVNKQYAVLDEMVLSKIPGCPFSDRKQH